MWSLTGANGVLWMRRSGPIRPATRGLLRRVRLRQLLSFDFLCDAVGVRACEVAWLTAATPSAGAFCHVLVSWLAASSGWWRGRGVVPLASSCRAVLSTRSSFASPALLSRDR